MTTVRRFLPFVALLATSTAASAASSPTGLAAALQQALNAGDFAAASALADIEGAPAEARFAYLDAVYSCVSEMICKVAVAPLDAEFRTGLAEDAKAYGAAPIAAEGIIVVTEKSRDGTGSGDLKMPYVKAGAEYRIAVMRPGPAALAKSKARTNDEITKSFLAKGIYDPKTNARRTDWATAAKPLPKDGGEAGRAFVASTSAMSKAVDAKDPDAAMHAGGRMAEIIFRDKDFDGKPLPKTERQKKLVAQSQRMLRDVKVEGGYQLGDDAVVVFTARNGSGWVERGAILLTKEADAWDVSGKETVSYPE
ncbi:MAG: hypothetical protein ABW186_17325 [Rhodanobacteraceae bacterium]